MSKLGVPRMLVRPDGAGLALERAARALTQERLAQRAGLDTARVNRAERGMAVTLVTLSRIAAALDLAPAVLVGEEL
jgi:transcriptional regulator with XRE-family HTH domain